MNRWMYGWMDRKVLPLGPTEFTLIHLNKSPHCVCGDVITLITSRFLLSSVFFLLLRPRMWVGRKERQLGQTCPSPSLLWRCSFDFRNCPLFTLRRVLLSVYCLQQRSEQRSASSSKSAAVFRSTPTVGT